MRNIILKYRLYETAVQDGQECVDLISMIGVDLMGRRPQSLREDFCGTHLVSSAWVRSDSNRTAIGIDLDRETLEVGKFFRRSELQPKQKRRLNLLHQNAISVTTPLSDVAVAFNFSFFTLKKRDDLKRYFQCVRKSLRSDGLLILETAGGPGFTEKTKERKQVTLPCGSKYTYVWDQTSFDPIHRNGHYEIHFLSKTARSLNRAFHYDWRIWTIPELRELLHEAGFRETFVYWETSDRSGHGTGMYQRLEVGDPAHSWIAYVVGRR